MIEGDEVWSYLGSKKQPIWLWWGIDQATLTAKLLGQQLPKAPHLLDCNDGHKPA